MYILATGVNTITPDDQEKNMLEDCFGNSIQIKKSLCPFVMALQVKLRCILLAFIALEI